MPERLAVAIVEGHDVAAAITREQQSSSRGQDASDGTPAGKRLPPRDLAVLRLDGRQGRPGLSPLRDPLAAKSDRPPVIRFGEVEEIEVVAFLGIEETRRGRIRRRGPIGDAAFNRRHDRAWHDRLLAGLYDTRLPDTRTPVREGAELRGH